jgi:hypothetical protein
MRLLSVLRLRDDGSLLSLHGLPFEVFETMHTHNFGRERFNESELLEQHLYGRYLHGDFGKWMHAEQTPNSTRDSALWSARHARAKRVMQLGTIVQAGVRDGVLAYESSNHL